MSVGILLGTAYWLGEPKNQARKFLGWRDPRLSNYFGIYWNIIEGNAKECPWGIG